MSKVVPFALKNEPSLIESLFPVQKLSLESFKEQEARQSKTLTTLGSYWKGRKPLILNKACILGALLPATKNAEEDLEVFQLLMGMDDSSIKIRLALEPSAQLPSEPYRSLVEAARRPEELGDALYDHIWTRVNQHLNTSARTISELVEQLGVMRFGHRPIVADTFCGSGQIPFEAARLGCDVNASDLNPIACMLTWGARHLVGATEVEHRRIIQEQKEVFSRIKGAVDRLGVESDGNGWQAKAYLYCVEVTCPESGWSVPLLPSLLVSKGHRVLAVLKPDSRTKTYAIELKQNATDAELAASVGTVISEGRESYVVHTVEGVTYRSKISTIRGDSQRVSDVPSSKIRLWEESDFAPRSTDVFRERLYAILWTRTPGSRASDQEFRHVTKEDLAREDVVTNYVREHLDDWQRKGLIPDMKIEVGDETARLQRERGWTYWHHLFNPRQLLSAALINAFTDSRQKFGFFQVLNNNSRLSRWNARSGVGQTASVFDNQALNTLYNYGCRAINFCEGFLTQEYKNFPIKEHIQFEVANHPASELRKSADIFITDPPYGDAVKYEEIFEYFIGWMKKSPPKEFAVWTWDSRRALAIKGEDDEFRQGMVKAYSKMATLMPENGIQIIMFTHQSGSIWADMANIVWAAGLQVTAAWYVVTETDSPLRDGSYVKGTVLLVLRKRREVLRISRDDLAWEIQEEVEKQVADLTGLNQKTKAANRNENLFEDADLQMAGYAAALRVLTKYSVIDGRDMPSEAIKPRIRGEKTFVDNLIEFAVSTANQALVPQGLAKSTWDKLLPSERFILKMLDMEARGAKTLDNYQNFAKAFKVRNFSAFLESRSANNARLKGAIEFGKTEMNEGSELYQSTLRAVYYAMWELSKSLDEAEVLQHLSFNVKDYFSVPSQREMVISICSYLAGKLEQVRSEEAALARIAGELVRNQRLG